MAYIVLNNRKGYHFDVKTVTEDLIQWIKDWFEVNGNGCNAVIGVSGGKDSTVVAKLCCEALGADRVIGVMMPNGEQKDISDSIRVCEILGIRNFTINIEGAVKHTLSQMKSCGIEVSEQTRTNLPARIRMSTLYAVSQSNNGRVSNNCNKCEDVVGYSTRYGDSVGDFSPLSELTTIEIMQIGDYLGLPHDLVHKTPIDGLNTNSDGSYVTDEQSLGVTYEDIHNYIRGEKKLPYSVFDVIKNKEEKNRFKLGLMPKYAPNYSNLYNDCMIDMLD